MALTTRSDTTFHRPPRAFPPAVPTDEFTLAAPPSVASQHFEGWLYVLFPVLGSLGMVAFAILYDNKIFLYIAIGMACLALFYGLAMRSNQKRSGKRSRRRQRRLYRAYLAATEHRLADVAETQRAAAERRHPEHDLLAHIASSRTHLWERRPGDSDFLAVRTGRAPVAHAGRPHLDLGNNPLTEYEPALVEQARELAARWSTIADVPVAVGLTAAPVLCVVGAAPRARACARSMLTQLAVAHAPSDLRVAVSYAGDPGEWEWCKWLPHARGEATGGRVTVPRPALCGDTERLAALLDEQVAPRIDGLRMLTDASTRQEAVTIDAPHLVLVLDAFSPRDARARLPLLREALARAAELRIIVICLVEDGDDEPAEAGARLRLHERGASSLEETGPAGHVQQEVTVDESDPDEAEAIARTLAPVRLHDTTVVAGLDPRDGLLSLLGLPDVTALDPRAEWRTRPRALALQATIGVDGAGRRLVLDLKQSAEGGMGPHGLIIGATGSGKSELLRTLIMSLALAHSPEELAFVFVDFKGGAAFADLETLPHTAGMITNLQSDLSMVDRMHDALHGEQERRQRMLRDAGNVDDVIAYRRLRERQPSLPALPDLLVVIDEFGELLASRPEYIELFIAIGRVGRSLGIHLLFSSQRFDEGRLRGLESHLRYRICLRTFSADDSRAVLGTPDAYLLPAEPGLGYLKVDTGVYDRFRATLVRQPGSAHGDGGPPPVHRFAADPEPATALDLAGGRRAADAAAGGDLRLIAERLRDAHAGGPVHQVWCAPLEPHVALGALAAPPAFWEQRAPMSALRATIGTVDVPKQQRTEPLTIELAGTAGHAAVVGAPQSGKSTLLRTLALALTRTHTPEELQIYAIDLGGGLLRALGDLPHVGAVAGKPDRELVHRIVARVQSELVEREQAFRRLGLDGMPDVHARRAAGAGLGAGSGGEAPAFCEIVLLIDGWAQLRRDFEDLDAEIEGLLSVGLTYGVHVVISANRWGEMRASTTDGLGTRLELRLNDPLDSQVDRKRAATLPAGAPGRGLTREGLEFQAALPRLDRVASADDIGPATASAIAAIAARWTGPPASAVRVLPRRLEREELPPSHEIGLPIGVEEERLDTVGIDLSANDAHMLILGDGESGRTNVLRAIVEGLGAQPGGCAVTVFDIRRTMADVAGLPHVGYAGNRAAMHESVTALTQQLMARVEETRDGATHASGPALYLVVDDYDLLAGDENPLESLAGALPHGRDLNFHLILARRVGGMIRASYETVVQALLELRVPGLILSGDPSEGVLMEATRACELPPGRGRLIRRGRSQLVQTVLAPPRSDGHAAAPHVLTGEERR